MSTSHTMPHSPIVRVWRGATTLANAAGYERHVTTVVANGLVSLPGYLGMTVLRRRDGERVEFLVMTRWTSMDAVTAFAGASIDLAVVEPEARALLADFDTVVRHFEVASGVTP
ncbi:MAG: antibiotic biosynthesis monooxygenase [Vicinamibacterales bacterium]